MAKKENVKVPRDRWGEGKSSAPTRDGLTLGDNNKKK